ncbi:MAG: tRNA 2-thiouridine(34) synthase MnmA [bacterium]|nr:tRNA 2-thiouridine(34) synthase MnmA [bacterium]
MPRTVVGLSGGVDSALVAALLKERGFDVVGCYLKVAVAGAPCPWQEDLPMAHRVAAHLDIPLIVRDVSAEYEREVLEPMVAAYRAGETPNPDILCNRWVKFDVLIAAAREVGAERIATGHYARVRKYFSPSRQEGEREGEGSIVELHRGLDHTKDQSYFLATLTQEQLAWCEFPLGEWQKEDVRAEAKRRGLPNWDRHSTSGVCFIGHTNIAEFLASRAAATPATVVTTSGEVLGTVPVGEALTVGQRAPIAGQPAPRYVVATEPTAQRVTVSATIDDPARFASVIYASAPYWISAAPSFPLRCSVRIRHRQEPVPCVVSLRGSAGDRSNPGLHVQLDIPLTGVAPGQTVVLSDGDRILGSATIDVRPQP